MGETVNWSDQRDAQRQRTLKRGRALVNGVEVAAVTVRNMSLTGARLISPDCAGLPDAFTLSVGDEGLIRDVEVRSRSATGMGVRFLKPLSTREFGAEFLQARTTGERERTVAEQRADLVRRAREGLERMDLGFTAPPLAMPEPEPEPVADETVADETVADETVAPDGDGVPTDDGTIDTGTADTGTDAVRDDAVPVPAMPAPTVAASAAPPAPDDDGLGEGALGRVEPGHPPRAIRRRLPWSAPPRAAARAPLTTP